MEKSFDFGALLRNNEKKHKSKPTQFVSVQGGILKRLENNLKVRKSTRLTTFDQIRNLAIPESPAKSDAQLKIEHRRQQLEKWKEEKEKKKKEAAAHKKKPFIVGAAHNPMKYVPPPAPPKPSTSGRVTRSQTAKASIKPKPTPKQKTLLSFAPINASFKPPELKIKIPVLAPPSKTKSRKVNITFEPVTHKAETQSRCKTAQKAPPQQLETRSLRSKTTTTKKTTPKSIRVTKFMVESSSSSEVEAPKPVKRIQTPGPMKYAAKSASKGVPKVLTLTSTENSGSETDSIEKPKRQGSIRNSVQIIASTSQLSSESQSSFEDQLTTKNVTDSDNFNSELSDIELVSNKSPLNFDSTPDSGKNSDLETLSADKSKLNKSFSSDIEIVEIKSKTPRKSLSRSITDSGKSSDVEFVQNTPLNKRNSRNFVTPKNMGVPKSESNSEERLRSPKNPHESPLTPEQMEIVKKISPCVTLSRGKDKARREMKWKMSEGMLDVDSSDIDSVEHFRRQLKSEKARMTEMCETWERFFEQNTLPETVQEAILSAVGQANLLMSKKLCQFAELVERCAKPEPGTALVTPADLHGFWDMVFMQVENIDMRFKKLEELKAQNWVEKPVEIKKKVVKGPAKKIVKAAGPNSRLKDVIAAARKAKQNQPTPTIQAPSEPSEQTEKTFDAGFFSVRSPVRSPRPICTPSNKNTLLKAVLSSEAKRASVSKNTASFAMLRASLMSKCDGPISGQTTPQMTPINLYATPGRSILKSTNIDTSKKSGKKSIKLVLFDDSMIDDLDTSTSPFSDNMFTARENNSSKIDGVEELTQDEIEENDTEMTVKEIKKPTLKRQNATEFEVRVVMTRNQRKSLNQSLNQQNEIEGRMTRSHDTKTEKVEEKTPRKSARKTKENTPKRSTQKKNKTTDNNETIDNDLIELKTPKRSTRKKALQEVEMNVVEVISTPKRMSRRRKTQDLLT